MKIPNVEEALLVSRVSVGDADVSCKSLHLGSRLDGKHEGFESL